MRILCLSSDFLPAVGGISQMVHGLAGALVDLGHAVTMVAPGPAGPGDAALPYPLVRDAPAPGWGAGWLARARHHRATAGRVDRLVAAHRPEVILLGVYQTYGDACLSISRRRGVPVAGLVYGHDLLSALALDRSGPRAWAARLVGLPSERERMLAYLDGLDRVFAISIATAELVRQASGRESDVVGCGVPASMARGMTPAASARAGRAAARARLGVPEAPTIGYLGRLIPRKNVEAILRALTVLPACRAVVAGAGPAEDGLRALAAELGVEGRVTFAGRVPDTAKADWFRAMDVFCLPSRRLGDRDVEGFGIVFLEATALGVPVVGGRSGGIPDVVLHERTGLLADPEDWRDVAACLDRLIEDGALADRCVAAAQARLAAEFTWPAVARRVLAGLEAARAGRA